MRRNWAWIVLVIAGCSGDGSDDVDESTVGVDDSALSATQHTATGSASDTGPTDTGPTTTGAAGLACGTFVSATSIGGAGFDVAAVAVAVAPDGTTWATATFTEPVVLDPGGPAETTLVPAGFGDVFVAGYDPAGALLWSTQVAATSLASVAAVAPTSDGFVVVGSYGGDATFGRGEASETTLPNGNPDGSFDTFVARYDAAGALQWARRAGGAANDYPSAAVVLSDDDVLVVGGYQGPATFGAGEAGETVLPLDPGAVSGGFLARFDAGGDLEWAQAVRGSTGEHVTGIVADASDALTVVGYAVGPGVTVFAEGQANETHLDPDAAPDAPYGWIGRWQPDGTFDWLVADPVSWASVDLAPDGSLIVGGTFYQSATLGAGLPTEATLASATKDLVAARYDAAGAFQWAAQSRSSGESVVHQVDLVATGDGGAAVVGTFDGLVRLGEGEPTETALQTTMGPLNSTNAFAARLGPAGDHVCSWSIGSGNGSGLLYGIAARPDGTSLVTGAFDGSIRLGEGQPTETELTAVGSFDALYATYGF